MALDYAGSVAFIVVGIDCVWSGPFLQSEVASARFRMRIMILALTNIDYAPTVAN